MGLSTMSDLDYHITTMLTVPTSKAPAIDLLLSSVIGKSREIQIASHKCMTCGGDAVDFKDDISRKEYNISGMCQECQNIIFG